MVGDGAAFHQVLGYNGQLYSHHSIAAKSPNGVVAISILAKVSIYMEHNRFLAKS